MNLATKLLVRQQASKAKLERLRETTERAKYQDCSFQPQLHLAKKSLRNNSEVSSITRYVVHLIIEKYMGR